MAVALSEAAAEHLVFVIAFAAITSMKSMPPAPSNLLNCRIFPVALMVRSPEMMHIILAAAHKPNRIKTVATFY